MKLIDVSTPKHPNTFTMVDDADFDWLNQWKWSACKGRKTFYGRRTIHDKNICMPIHRFILGASIGSLVDHVDCNGLNNQRYNLRFASKTTNTFNIGLRVTNTSGFIGVGWRERSKLWEAAISVKSKSVYLGLFQSKEEAARERDLAAMKYHGEFARLNFPDIPGSGGLRNPTTGERLDP